jgi:DNA-binding transcriptional regulator YhcF (GntR family)
MGRKRNKLSRFVAIQWEIIDSEAWAALTNASRVAFVHLKRKVTNPNPGELSLSYNEMEKFMNRHTYAKALRELENVGFISKEQHGGLFRRRNFFKLSEEWRRYKEKSSAKNNTVTSAKSGTVKVGSAIR